MKGDNGWRWAEEACLFRDGGFELCCALGVAEEADFGAGCRLDEWGYNAPEAPEDEGGIQEPELRQALWDMLLQHFKDCQQSFRVQIP